MKVTLKKCKIEKIDAGRYLGIKTGKIIGKQLIYKQNQKIFKVEKGIDNYYFFIKKRNEYLICGTFGRSEYLCSSVKELRIIYQMLEIFINQVELPDLLMGRCYL